MASSREKGGWFDGCLALETFLESMCLGLVLRLCQFVRGGSDCSTGAVCGESDVCALPIFVLQNLGGFTVPTFSAP